MNAQIVYAMVKASGITPEEEHELKELIKGNNKVKTKKELSAKTIINRYIEKQIVKNNK